MKKNSTPYHHLIEKFDPELDLHNLEWQVEYSFNDILSFLYLPQLEVREDITKKLFEKIKHS